MTAARGDKLLNIVFVYIYWFLFIEILSNSELFLLADYCIGIIFCLKERYKFPPAFRVVSFVLWFSL